MLSTDGIIPSALWHQGKSHSLQFKYGKEHSHHQNIAKNGIIAQRVLPVLGLYQRLHLCPKQQFDMYSLTSKVKSLLLLSFHASPITFYTETNAVPLIFSMQRNPQHRTHGVGMELSQNEWGIRKWIKAKWHTRPLYLNAEIEL